MPGVVRVELWISADDLSTAVSDEEKLRGGDQKIEACMLVEALRESELRTAALEVDKRLVEHVDEVGLYRRLCDLLH